MRICACGIPSNLQDLMRALRSKRSPYEDTYPAEKISMAGVNGDFGDGSSSYHAVGSVTSFRREIATLLTRGRMYLSHVCTILESNIDIPKDRHQEVPSVPCDLPHRPKQPSSNWRAQFNILRGSKAMYDFFCMHRLEGLQ